MTLLRNIIALLPLRRAGYYSHLASEEPSDDAEGEAQNEKSIAAGSGVVSRVLRSKYEDFIAYAKSSRLLFLLLTCLVHTIVFLLPSFITNIFRHRARGQRHSTQTIRPTAYLDGLRGVAALIVYIFHYGYLWYPILRNGYLSTPDNNMFLQRPIVRFLHSGRASVTIFFVISGYVLTIKPLGLIHKGQNEKVLDTLADSLFRRPFRLYLPIIASTGIIAIVAHMHFWVPGPVHGMVPVVAGDISGQFWHWWGTIREVTNIFRVITSRVNGYANNYNEHLWTIPVEFKGSVLVFLLLLAFSKARTWVRLVAIATVGWWQVTLGDFDQALFCAGLWLAELSVILPPSSFSSFYSKPSSRMSEYAHAFAHVATIILFIFGLHLCSYPERLGPFSPGFRTLSQHVQAAFYRGNEELIQQYWISVGSIVIIIALMYSPPLRRRSGASDSNSGETLSAGRSASQPFLQHLFTNKFSQYLGDISYSLYLFHGFVNHIVGTRWLGPAFTSLQLSDGQVKQYTAKGLTWEADQARADAMRNYSSLFIWGTIANTITLFWISDVFTRAVDTPAVKLVRKFGEWIKKK